MAEIEVYLRSTVLPSQLTSLHYSYDYHYYMEDHYRGNYHWLRDQGFSKGRIFEPDSAALLPILEKAVVAFDGFIRIYELNTLRGKLRGYRVGIFRAPGVLIGRDKHLGLPDARSALLNLMDTQPGTLKR